MATDTTECDRIPAFWCEEKPEAARRTKPWQAGHTHRREGYYEGRRLRGAGEGGIRLHTEHRRSNCGPQVGHKVVFCPAHTPRPPVYKSGVQRFPEPEKDTEDSCGATFCNV